MQLVSVIPDLSLEITKAEQRYFNYGEYADIWKGIRKRDSGECDILVVKVFRGISSDTEVRRHVAQDLLELLQVWRRVHLLHHPYIVPFFGLCHGLSALLALVIPYYANGNVLDYLKTRPGADRIRLISEVACALEYLHCVPTIHGDLKASNILVDDDGHACLADFGLVTVISQSDFTTSKIAGSCRWQPHEVINPLDDGGNQVQAVLTPESDVWSWAMTVIEILTGKEPFAHRKQDSVVIFDIIGGAHPQRPDVPEVTEKLWDLLISCWSWNPAYRPRMSTVVQKLFKGGFKWDSYVQKHTVHRFL